MSKRERLVWIILTLFVLVTVYFSMGCNGQSVKPSNKLETAVKASMKNQQRMEEKIDNVGGNLTKVQQSFSSFETKITNVVNQKFETFQGSTRLQFEKFTGEMKTITETNTNSTGYGIGLVVVVLIFALLLIWGMSNMLKGLAGKVLR